MRPLKFGRIIAMARMTQQGLLIGFLDGEIGNRREKLVATVTCTCMTIST